MLKLVTTLRCSSCSFRAPSQAAAKYPAWLGQRIDFLRQECRNTRRLVIMALAFFAGLIPLLSLYY